MPTSFAQTFIDALRALEDEGDPERLVALYDDDAPSDNLTATGEHRGADGARTFWKADRDLFDTVHSEFRNTVESEGAVVLEWVRTGTSRDGSEVRYGGVSVIEVRGEKIARFQAYYDPAALGAQTP